MRCLIGAAARLSLFDGALASISAAGSDSCLAGAGAFLQSTRPLPTMPLISTQRRRGEVHRNQPVRRLCRTDLFDHGGGMADHDRAADSRGRRCLSLQQYRNHCEVICDILDKRTRIGLSMEMKHVLAGLQGRNRGVISVINGWGIYPR